ncbi:uncharacterized protein LOC121305582 isoform X2 [Polyodon spathula]|uniref:uncharacterized protein LOC121305582 isoform X2 n=1 Tax=Polyodon spathula TaxID=7913 RepID=UPI001B7E97E9|nr:uncharacterized protein LOC121305582 isoform X2 [Polyodon spathula]
MLNRFGSTLNFSASTPRVNSNETGHQSSSPFCLYSTFRVQREAETHRAQDKTADTLREEKLGTRTLAMDQPQSTQPSSPLRPSVREEGPAVTIRFEKVQNRIQKFREGHPGSLGVTQIMLCVFFFACGTIQYGSPFAEHWAEVAAVFLIKACFCMEVLGSACTGFMLFIYSWPTVGYYSSYHPYCEYRFWNETHSQELKLCQKYELISDFVYMESLFALAAQVAVSITIASYCCKAVQCCGAPRSVPVISVQQPSQQAEG